MSARATSAVMPFTPDPHGLGNGSIACQSEGTQWTPASGRAGERNGRYGMPQARALATPVRGANG